MQFYTNELLKNLKEFLFQKRLWPADITAFGEQNSDMKLDLAHPQAASAISTPRLLIQPTDSMWAAPQLMQEHWGQQLMVTCETGELVSIITKTGGFEPINPTETYQTVETLQHLIHKQTSELRQLNQQLQEEISKRQLLEEKLNTSAAQCQQAEAALRESEERCRSAFDQAAIGKALITLDGRYLQVNRSLCDMVGYSEQELLTKTFQDITHPIDVECDLHYLRQLLSGEIRTYQIEKRYFHKDGHIVWILLSGSLMRDAQGQPLYFITQIQDITERKQVEESLRQSEATNRALISAIPDLIMRLKKDGTYLNFIPAQNFRTVNSNREMQGKTLWDTMPRDFAEERMYYVERALTTGEIQVYEFQLEIDGQIQYEEARIVVSGPDEVLILVRDISERKIIEARLRLLERAIAASNNGIIISDARAPDNPVVYANSGFERITGYTKEEVIGKNCRFLQETDKTQPALEKLKRAVAEARETQVVLRNYRKDGTLFWNEFCITPVRDETGHLTHFIGIQNDISDRFQAEEVLRQSEERFRVLVNSAPVGIFQTDLMGDCLFVNPRWLEIAGLSREDALGIGWENVLHPDDCDSVFTQWYDAAATGREFAMECRFLTPQGKVRWVFSTAVPLRDASGAIIGYIGTVTDISDRKLAQEKLKKSEATLSTAQRVAHVGNWEVDALTGKIIWSEELFRIFGLDPTQPEPTFAEHIQKIHPEDRRLWQTTVSRALKSQEIYKFDFRILRPDGEIRYLEGRGETVVNEQGQVIKLFGTALDITERKSVEKALRQSTQREREKAQELEQTLKQLKCTQSQLIQSEKMSSLGQMVAGIAHEINNPISFIYGNIKPAMEYAQDLLHLVDLYRRHYPKPVAEIAEHLERIDPDFITEDFPKLLESMKEGTSRINQIVLSLRNFCHLDESENKQVDIHEGIDNTLLILQHRLKQQSKRSEIRVIKEYGRLPKVECYPSQLNQAFMNIISNAIDAFDETTEKEAGFEPTIRIFTAVIKGDSFSSNFLGHRSGSRNVQSSSRILIRITDNGSGINTRALPKIFDPFFTTKPVGSGTGLGLSISYQIVVERHGGQLKCYSTPDVGTEFAIELPIAQSTTLHPTFLS